MSKLTTSELIDSGICPACYDREHNHEVYGDNKDKILIDDIKKKEKFIFFLKK